MVSQVLRDSASVVIPEHWGAKGDGVTDDASVISSVINSNLGKTILFTKEYLLASPIDIDLGGSDLTLVFDSDAKITSDYEEAGAYNTLQGLVRFHSGGNIIIQGMNIESYNTGLSYYDGLLIEESGTVVLDNVSSKYAGQNGIRIVSVDNLYAQNCKADSNLYAGLHVNNAKHATVVGGTFNYNGSMPYLNGYGITFSHQFFETDINRDVTITGVQANYNYRKGLDVHGGIGVSITNNFVKGFATAGIYAVGGSGGEANDAFDVRDVIISNNIVDVDSTWYKTLDFSGYKALYTMGNTTGILFGSYEPTSSVADMTEFGVYKVTNNIIKNFVAWDGSTLRSDYAIRSFVGKAYSIEIKDNTIYNSKLSFAPLAVGGGNTLTEANTVRISENTIDSCYSDEDGIIVTAGKTIGITGNHFSNFTIDTAAARGAVIMLTYAYESNIEAVNISNNFTNNTIARFGISVISNTTYDMDVTITNNVLKGTYTVRTISDLASPLGLYVKDNIGQSNFSSSLGQDKGQQSYSTLNRLIAETGNVDYAVELDEDTTHLNAFTIENTFTNGQLFAEIEVTGVRAPTTAGEYNIIAIYKYYARSYYNSVPDTLFSTDDVSILTIAGDSAGVVNMKPTVQWVGTGLVRTLQFLFPRPYVTYNIAIKYTSFGLKGIYND